MQYEALRGAVCCNAKFVEFKDIVSKYVGVGVCAGLDWQPSVIARDVMA